MLPLSRTVPDRPWVLGIRPKSATWLRRVRSLLLLTFVDDAPGAATEAAELGLGLPPSLYWYVFRTDEDFGHIVFLWETTGDLVATDGAVTPFDTGGVWQGHITTDPALDPEVRSRFVAVHSRPVSEWLETLQLWIRANYSGTAGYVLGEPPRIGVPGIVYDSRNQARAWTWEARIEKAAYRQQVGIRHVFWSADDRKAFEDWVESVDSGLDERMAETLLVVVERASVEIPRTERANEEVVRHLLRMAGDE
jgi:hypothetical protein